MDLSEFFLYALRFYLVNYLGSALMFFTGMPVLYIRVFQVIFYTLGVIYLSIAIYYRLKNGKIETNIKEINDSEKDIKK